MSRALYFYDPKSKNYIGEFPHDPEVGFVASRRGIRRKLCPASDVDHLADNALENHVWQLYLAKERELRDKQRKEKTEKDKKRLAEKRMSVSQAKPLFVKDLKRRKRSQETIDSYIRSVDYYIKACGDHPVREFNRDKNMLFYDFLAEYKYKRKSLTAATQNKHMRHLGIFMNVVYKHEIIDRKFVLEKESVPHKDMDTYKVADLKRAKALIERRLETYTRPKDIRAAKNLMRAFMLGTQGLLRVGHIWSLKLENIDMGRRIIRITEVPELGWKPKAMTFTNKPINKALFNFLKEDLKNRSPKEKWFLDKGNGEQWLRDCNNVTASASKLFKEVGLPSIKPFHHGMRATMITWLLNNGEKPTDVQQLADHKHLSTTMKYFNTRTVKQAAAASSLPEI